MLELEPVAKVRQLVKAQPQRLDITAELLGGFIVARGFLQLLDVRRRQLRPIDFERQLVKRAGELVSIGMIPV
jgi:hypothetical protein